DIWRHFRVPTLGAMAEVHARFQKLAQIVIRQCHERLLFSGWPRAGVDLPDRKTGRAGTGWPAVRSNSGPAPRCGMARLIGAYPRPRKHTLWGPNTTSP